MMSQLYYQYTHLNNKEIDELRSFFSDSSGKVQLISSYEFSSFPNNIFFGKLLRVELPVENIDTIYLTTIVQRFSYLKLILVNSNNIYFSPTLYKKYRDLVIKSKVEKNLLWSFFVSVLYLYLNLYRIRYNLINTNSILSVNSDLNTSFFYVC